MIMLLSIASRQTARSFLRLSKQCKCEDELNCTEDDRADPKYHRASKAGDPRFVVLATCPEDEPVVVNKHVEEIHLRVPSRSRHLVQPLMSNLVFVAETPHAITVEERNSQRTGRQRCERDQGRKKPRISTRV